MILVKKEKCFKTSPYVVIHFYQMWTFRVGVPVFEKNALFFLPINGTSGGEKMSPKDIVFGLLGDSH